MTKDSVNDKVLPLTTDQCRRVALFQIITALGLAIIGFDDNASVTVACRLIVYHTFFHFFVENNKAENNSKINKSCERRNFAGEYSWDRFCWNTFVLDNHTETISRVNIRILRWSKINSRRVQFMTSTQKSIRNCQTCKVFQPSLLGRISRESTNLFSCPTKYFCWCASVCPQTVSKYLYYVQSETTPGSIRSGAWMHPCLLELRSNDSEQVPLRFFLLVVSPSFSPRGKLLVTND